MTAVDHEHEAEKREYMRDIDDTRTHSTPYIGKPRRREAIIDDLVIVLRRYMAAYPAFRMAPVGAPGSAARFEQASLMGLEDAAKEALAKATAL
jgi:hypothetical protein